MSWITELERFPFFKDKYTLVQKEKDLKSQTPIIIYTHDFPKGKSRERKGSGRPHLSKVLGKMRPNLLIVDEIHGIKKGTDRTKHLSYVRQKSRRVLGLTGTPTEGNLTELHHLLRFVYQKNWVYESAESFSKHFGKKEKIRGNFIQGGSYREDGPEKFLRQLDYEKMPRYYNLLNRYIHRLSINDPEVRKCLTIPETEAILHCLQPTSLQGELYKQYLDIHRSQLLRASQGLTAQHRAEALQLINPLIKIANSYYAETPKLDKVVQIVQEAQGKVIVYCDRVDSAWSVSQILRANFPGQVVRVYAKDEREKKPVSSEDDRIAAVTSFQFDPQIRISVLSINLASQAIDLNQASDVVYYCLPWSSIKIQQSISRPVGPGNPYSTVQIHYLYQTGFIDEYQVLLATKKIKSSRLLLDYEVEMENEEDLSPIDAIRNLLANR